MQIYSIRTTVQSEQAIIDFAEGDAVSSCFIYDRADLNTLAAPLRAVAQRGYTPANIGTTDYISASIKVPVFSLRFHDVLGERLSEELEFFPCTVACQNVSFEFLAAKTLKALPLVDPDKSQYRTLASGASILLRAVYRDSIDEDFLICRDTESRGRLIVSEQFRKLCASYSLDIEFGTPV